MSDTTTQIIFMDASALKGSACNLRLMRTVVDGYRGKLNTVDIEYGTAFHAMANAHATNGGNLNKSCRAATAHITSTPFAKKDKKEWMENPSAIKMTCFEWSQWWESAENNLEVVQVEGKPLTELKFDVPYLRIESKVTPGKFFEIHLAGTVDRICRVRGSDPRRSYVMLDFKTTSSWDKDDYLSKYALDPQLPFYKLLITKMAELYPDSIYAHIIQTGVVGIIEGVFLNASNGTSIKRYIPFSYKMEFMAAFERMLRRKIVDLVEYLITDTKPEKEGIVNGSCTQMKFGCPYDTVCAAPDDRAGEYLLRSSFIQKKYNPLEFR